MADNDIDRSAAEALHAIWHAAGGADEALGAVALTGAGDLSSVFATTSLAVASIAAAGLAVAELAAARHGALPRLRADRRLASFWFADSIRPDGWALPPAWDAVAGDYRCADGWIRLHTNAPHHRAAALAVLGVPAERERVAQVVAGWSGEALESAIVDNGGCAAQMRSLDDWAVHPQGAAVAAEPLLWRETFDAATRPAWTVPADRPLAGIRVLDLTRILAGPTATRFLAGYGATVLRLDPPGWEEPSLQPEVTLGKRCARIDLRSDPGRTLFERLLREADVIVHGYRADALERLGLGAGRRRELNPGLVDVSLDAYGWTGPWRRRRGFDSLVQMSSGIAEAGMRLRGRDAPTPLPVQALDCAAGYIMAGAAVRGLAERLRAGSGSSARASLARVAATLAALRAPDCVERPQPAPASQADVAGTIEHTPWGPARRLRPPLELDRAPMRWDLPAASLGSSPAQW
ncbi:CoA transferase [Pigmentiphaga soli]|uniref:CoA transferase n=1 Tax=Pigmentiphaga soli TaxID=1007095 RepID=A0ABP8HGT2_9BURK